MVKLRLSLERSEEWFVNPGSQTILGISKVPPLGFEGVEENGVECGHG